MDTHKPLFGGLNAEWRQTGLQAACCLVQSMQMQPDKPAGMSWIHSVCVTSIPLCEHRKDSKNYNSPICGHVSIKTPNSILGAVCSVESQAASDRAVIKQSCINTSLFLCGLLGIVCLSWRPVFIKQKKSPNKIRSHLDRKCSLLLPGIQTVEILPHIVNLPLTRGLHKKPVLLTSLLKLTPDVYDPSVPFKQLVFNGRSGFMTFYDIVPSLLAQIFRFSYSKVNRSVCVPGLSASLSPVESHVK